MQGLGLLLNGSPDMLIKVLVKTSRVTDRETILFESFRFRELSYLVRIMDYFHYLLIYWLSLFSFQDKWPYLKLQIHFVPINQLFHPYFIIFLSLIKKCADKLTPCLPAAVCSLSQKSSGALGHQLQSSPKTRATTGPLCRGMWLNSSQAHMQ